MNLKLFRKLKKIIFPAIFCVANVFCVLKANAQDIEAKITIASPAIVRVEGKILNVKNDLASKNWSFPKNYADVSHLERRFENLNFFDAKGKKLLHKKLSDNEFETSETAFSFQYDVNVEVSKSPTDAAHISWLSGGEQGLLMLADLLPQLKKSQPVSARIAFDLPKDWRIASGETRTDENTFAVKDYEKAVFLIGKNWREMSARIDKTDLSLVISGERQFADAEAFEMAKAILSEHEKVFGGIPAAKVQIFLLPFPQPVGFERWRAETRGATVTIISAPTTFKSAAQNRLHEQLRHEIFHLWLPNALNLTGNYAWFYEGFTVYLALRTGVELNQIRFEDFLNTLSQAFDLAKTQNVSLLESSNRRWQNGGNLIYAKGLIVAFLCDATLLRAGKGKRSVSNVFREIYQKHRFPNPPQDGNAAILSVLKSYPELVPIVQNYVEGASKIEWQNELNAFGIEAVENNFGTRLKILPKLGGRQKDLLNELGYNQWRKLLQKTK